MSDATTAATKAAQRWWFVETNPFRAIDLLRTIDVDKQWAAQAREVIDAQLETMVPPRFASTERTRKPAAHDLDTAFRAVDFIARYLDAPCWEDCSALPRSQRRAMQARQVAARARALDVYKRLVGDVESSCPEDFLGPKKEPVVRVEWMGRYEDCTLWRTAYPSAGDTFVHFLRTELHDGKLVSVRLMTREEAMKEVKG